MSLEHRDLKMIDGDGEQKEDRRESDLRKAQHPLDYNELIFFCELFPEMKEGILLKFETMKLLLKQRIDAITTDDTFNVIPINSDARLFNREVFSKTNVTKMAHLMDSNDLVYHSMLAYYETVVAPEILAL